MGECACMCVWGVRAWVQVRVGNLCACLYLSYMNIGHYYVTCPNQQRYTVQKRQELFLRKIILETILPSKSNNLCAINQGAGKYQMFCINPGN